jgi:hypothetical protein
MKTKLLKNMLLLSTTSVLLFACGNGENSEMDNEGNNIQTEENVDSVNSDENQNMEDNQEETETNENNTDQEQSESEGEPEETQDNQSELSEIVSMTDEERLAHHQNLGGSTDSVYENLLLPGIHENTRIYEGRINPGDSIIFEIPDAEASSERDSVTPEVSEDGYFLIEMAEYEFSVGDNIQVYITGSYPHEEGFSIPVHEAEEGMEEIRVRDVSESNDASEHTIKTNDTLTSIAAQYDVSTEDLQNWNGILDSSEIEEGMTIRVDGPNEEQAQKEEWQWDFERNLYEGYGVTVREYEDIGDGYYGVHVNEHDTGDLYYVTVDSETGDFHG